MPDLGTTRTDAHLTVPLHNVLLLQFQRCISFSLWPIERLFREKYRIREGASKLHSRKRHPMNRSRGFSGVTHAFRFCTVRGAAVDALWE